MTLTRISTALLIALFSFSIVACNASRKIKGGAIGSAAGAAIGGLIGHKSGNTVVGVLAGAAIGGTAGALIGRKMDKAAEELQSDLEGATVQRVGEGVLITFNEGLQFKVASYSIQSDSNENISDLSRILAKYPDTDILIEGHTDSDGEEEMNQNLSVQRAAAVQSALIEKGIPITRISTIGYGETQPVADNSTASGKQQNRRVEIAIYANKKMMKAAKSGNLE